LPITFRATKTDAARVKAELLAVPVFAKNELGPGADAVDAALGGTLDDFMKEVGFEGGAGEALAVPTGGRLGAKAVVLVGMGERDKLDLAGVRNAGATLAKRASKVASAASTLVDAVPDSIDRAAAAQAFAEGVALGSYQFLKYKGDAKASRLAKVTVVSRHGTQVQAALDRGARISDAVIWARDAVNEPSAAKSPAALADAIRKLLRGKGVTVKVLDGAAIARERMGGVAGVGQGSHQEPRFVQVTYSPPRPRGSIALVGKGVVFDSGGLSIKSASGMETMKTDMSGAAAVAAAMSVLTDLGVKSKVVAYMPLVENMPSGHAIRPGDVLKMRNGKTVEVLNTDAEGRLILADALALAGEAKPDAVIDLATLTGACVVALGEKIAGLMGSDDAWIDQVREAADRAGESVWPLPLPPEYRKLLDSEVADVKNVSGGGYGGALTAWLFLKEFTDGVPWAHLDIAGPARANSDDGYVVRGGTGFGVSTLVELVSNFTKPTT
jgi:leucyl aminopeptidase